MTAPTLDGLGRWTVVTDEGYGTFRERWVDAALGAAPREVVLSADGMHAVSRVSLPDAVARYSSEHALRHAVTAVAGRAGWAVVAIRAPEAPPAPPQCPEAPPDGVTEPGGGGAPARGLPVAATGDERRERLRALDLPGALRALAAWVEP